MAYQPVVFDFKDADNFEINGYISGDYKLIGHGIEQRSDNTTSITFDNLTNESAWKISVLVTQFLRDYKPGFQIEI